MSKKTEKVQDTEIDKKVKTDVKKVTPKKKKEKMDPIALSIVIAVVVLLVVAMIWTDYQMRVDGDVPVPSTSVSEPLVLDGAVNNENDASNVIFGKDVITKNPFVTDHTPAEITPYEPADIDGKSYYQVDVTIYKEQLKEEEELTEEEKNALYAPESIIHSDSYYVDATNSDIYVKDDADKLVKFEYIYE